MRITITDLKQPGVEIYTDYSENQLRRYFEPKPGLFVAESPLVIERALNDGYEPYSVLMDEAELKGPSLEIVERIERCGRGREIPIFMASKQVLDELPGFTLTRGLLCSMYRREKLSLKELLEKSKNVAILENVVNPTNLGAIFRSAAALHIDAVLMTSYCVDPLYRRSARVSMGTVFQVPWTYFDSEKIDFTLLKEMGYTTIAMALREDSVYIDDPVLKTLEKRAIIMGSEGPGLTHETLMQSEYVAKIPMTGGVDSLNVAAASAVAFWELTK